MAECAPDNHRGIEDREKPRRTGPSSAFVLLAGVVTIGHRQPEAGHRGSGWRSVERQENASQNGRHLPLASGSLSGPAFIESPQCRDLLAALGCRSRGHSKDA